MTVRPLVVDPHAYSSADAGKGSRSTCASASPPLFTMTRTATRPGRSTPPSTSRPLVEAADRLRYEYVTCSERHHPRRRRQGARWRYWDPARRSGTSRHAPNGSSCDVRPRARLPPPAGDRQALRHPRPHLQRPTDSRRRCRHAAGGFELARRRLPGCGARGDDALRALGPASVAGSPNITASSTDYEGAGGSLRRAADGPALDRRSDRAVPTPGGRARRRLGAVRAVDRRGARTPRTRAAPTAGSDARGDRSPRRSRSCCPSVGCSTRSTTPTPRSRRCGRRPRSGRRWRTWASGTARRSTTRRQLEALVPIAEAV